MPIVYKSKYEPQHVSNIQGGDLVGTINKLTSYFKLPGQKFEGEMHLPGHSFTGPGTRLELRLNDDGSWKNWSAPVDRVDLAAYHHDLEYAKHSDTANRNIADEAMVRELDSIENPTTRERIERGIVKPIISTKAKFGLGIQPYRSSRNDNGFNYANFRERASEIKVK